MSSLPVTQMETSTNLRTRVPGLALFSALVIVHVELTYRYRSLFWAGTNALEWIGPVIAVAMLTTVITIATILMLGAWARITRRAIQPRRRMVIMVFLIGSAAASAYFALGEDPFLMPFLFFISIASVCLTATEFRWRRFDPRPPTSPWLLVFGLLTAIALTYTVAEILYAQPARRSNVLQIGGPIAAVSIALGLLTAWRLTQRFRRKTLIRLAVIAFTCALPAFVLGVASLPPHGKNSSGAKNLVLITFDTLRADYCSVYGGHVPTPALERIAREGTRFDASYSLAPWTVPSMFGAFSSTYPRSLAPGHSFDEWLQQVAAYQFPNAPKLLAEQLRDAGYTTAAYIGNPLLGDPNGILRGFHTRQSWPTHVPRVRGPFANSPGLYALLAQIFRFETPPPLDSTRILTRAAVHFLRDNGRRPFFLWIHIMDPHDPYDPPGKYRTATGPWPLFGPSAPYWATPQLDERGNIDVAESDRAYVASLYDGEIAYADTCVEAILNQLDTLEILDRTFICINADHGEELWDHGRFGHGQSLYDELVRVPSLFSGPGILPQSIETPISAIDLMPTLSGLLSIEPDASWKGIDTSPILRGETTISPSPVVVQATNRSAWPHSFRAIRVGDWKLISDLETGPAALYDLRTDPDEQENLIDDSPDQRARLVSALQEWESVHIIESEGALQVDETQEAEMIERLRSMGYVE